MGRFSRTVKLGRERHLQFKVNGLILFLELILGVKDDLELRGVIPNSFEHIFDHIAHSKNAQYLVRASYLEIYKEEVRDLLQRDLNKRLEIKEKPDRGIYVKDLSTVLTKSIREIEKVMNIGYANRSVGATNMNEHSSRSHAIFIITIECCELGVDGKNHIRVGKLNLVDLAGSERQSKTQSEGERLKEATRINLSLSTLGNVISALVDKKSTHVPYRDSKLTRLLQDSLGGNSKTVMIANIGPASYNYEETINTLRYASRAKNIKNTPKINEDPKDALLREYQGEIERLKELLRSKPQAVQRSLQGRRSHRSESEDEPIDEGIPEENADGDSGLRETYLREQREKLAAEKERILSNANMVAEEKTRLLEDLKAKEAIIKDEQAQTKKLEEKLRSLESKLLCGDRSIVEHTKEQEAALEAHRKKLATQQKHERAIRAKMEAESDNLANLQETFTSLRQEVDVYTAKLKKTFEKLQVLKQEMADVQEDSIHQRQEHERIVDQITQELKLRYLILENFVPLDVRQNLEKRATFDEEEERWRLLPTLPTTENETVDCNDIRSSRFCLKPALGTRRPTCRYALLASRMRANPRYRGENILTLDLDLPCRTTLEYEPPQLAPQVIAALEAALQDEEALELDGSPSVFKVKSVSKKRKNKKSQPPPNSASTEDFPKPRGLVPR
uniref:Kinesin-like protein n=1 Tax=Schistocephalus solidus TaxID=70667 RepID=A0A0X3P5C0_SCHSO